MDLESRANSQKEAPRHKAQRELLNLDQEQFDSLAARAALSPEEAQAVTVMRGLNKFQDAEKRYSPEEKREQDRLTAQWEGTTIAQGKETRISDLYYGAVAKVGEYYTRAGSEGINRTPTPFEVQQLRLAVNQLRRAPGDPSMPYQIHKWRATPAEPFPGYHTLNELQQLERNAASDFTEENRERMDAEFTKWNTMFKEHLRNENTQIDGDENSETLPDVADFIAQFSDEMSERIDRLEKQIQT